MKICPTCDGYGMTRTPSKAEGHLTKNCMTCATRGYVDKPLAPVASVPAWTPPPPPVAGPEWYPVPGGQPDAWGKPAGHPQWGIDLNAVG